ncbi:hypothetical protein M0R45_001612 [Rubus argutus]|uniref:Uncharacterized protein n=1 Tax=Rubus argutus TaxID=59490 RepID=A0AAW1VL46_RUBAR
MHSRSNKGVDKEAGGEENVPSGKLVLDQGFKNETASLTVNPPPPTKFEPPLELTRRKKKKPKKKGLMNTLSEVFKKADANVPSLDLIENVPAYAQFLKNLHLHKRRFADNERFQLNEEVSAIIQHRLPQWKHEFGSFIIGYRIGDETFDGALMDLNTNVNIMPLATYRRLAIGPLKTTSVSLQLVDGATRLPVGIVKDVLIRVNKFILPVDFVVLDMNEDLHKDQECPIIFGKPFMATAGVKINVQKGTVCLKVLGEKVKLQVCQPCYTQEVIQEVFATDLVNGNQAKSERIFGPLNPLKPQVEDHSSIVAANQELQELSYLDDDDDDMFEDFVNSYGKNDREFAFSSLESEPDIIVASLPIHKIEAPSSYVPPDLDLDPYSSDPQTSSFRQIHQVDESTTTPQRLEVVQHTSTIHKRDRGILPTPYVPPHRRMFMLTSYIHPHEHTLSPSFESFKMRSSPCSEVQLEAIQCLREILGIGVNRMKIHECHPPPYTSCKSMVAPYMSCYGGRQMYFAPP